MTWTWWVPANWRIVKIFQYTSLLNIYVSWTCIRILQTHLLLMYLGYERETEKCPDWHLKFYTFDLHFAVINPNILTTLPEAVISGQNLKSYRKIKIFWLNCYRKYFDMPIVYLTRYSFSCSLSCWFQRGINNPAEHMI